jgi:predicted ATP-binding protein involved in virulence
MEGDTNKILPVLSYYGTGRLWAQKKERRDGDLVRFTRQMGYTDCLAAESNEKLMKKWFEKMTIQGSQNGGISPELSAVQQAVSMCFEGITGYSDIKTFFNLDTHSLDIQYTDPTEKRMRYPTEALSDGYKNTLSMIADIAYRMAVLNPFLLRDVLVETPGLVLIDEIDLHLHPLWQQRILNDLRRIFPKVQFIVTTHAPSVIHSVKKENLLILSDNTTAYPPVCEVYGSDANEILESVMGARKRPPEIQEMFNNFYNAMDSDNYIHAREILKAIEMLIGSNDSEYVSAAVSLDLAEL